MAKWPWEKTETRESQPFTDAFTQALYSIAGGVAITDPKALGSLEIAAGFWARAFASAKVTPMNNITAALTPSLLALIGRELCRRGETVLKIQVSGSKVQLLPAGSWDIQGGPEKDSWTYRIDIFGASIHRTEFSPSTGLLHFRYATDPGVPWVGLSPLAYARDTGTMAASLEKRLGQELGAVTARVIPMPAGPPETDEDEDNPAPYDSLKRDLATAKGEAYFVETTAAGHGDGPSAAPRQDWIQRRIGADPPETLEKIRNAVSETVLACCGVPVELAEIGQGTAAREAWRRFLHATIDPLGKLVAEELSEKFEFPVSLNFDSLMASDISGRARAFQSLVGGGMDITKAAALSGLMMAEE